MENRDAEIDAELMAARAIESLAQKDSQISSLCQEVAELKAQLASKPKFASEKEFKAKSPPPPPPPKPKRPVLASSDLFSKTPELKDRPGSPPSSPPPPPPPPPPPSPSPS